MAHEYDTSAPDSGSLGGAAPLHIGETAAWVAAYRAMESRRADRHFYDPFAHLFTTIYDTETDGTHNVALGLVVQRTVVFDEIINRAVLEDGIDTIVNLAAGYDARPYRLSLPRHLHWIDVDLPEVLDRKKAVIASAVPNCRLTSIAADLSRASERDALLSSLAEATHKAMVLTEGLLLYLEEADVISLATSLSRHQSFRLWLTDLMSPGACRQMNRVARPQLSALSTQLRFAPDDYEGFFGALGWQPILLRPFIAEMYRLDRGPKVPMLKPLATWIEPLRRMLLGGFDGTILLRRNGDASDDR